MSATGFWAALASSSWLSSLAGVFALSSGFASSGPFVCAHDSTLVKTDIMKTINKII